LRFNYRFNSCLDARLVQPEQVVFLVSQPKLDILRCEEVDGALKMFVIFLEECFRRLEEYPGDASVKYLVDHDLVKHVLLTLSVRCDSVELQQGSLEDHDELFDTCHDVVFDLLRSEHYCLSRHYTRVIVLITMALASQILSVRCSLLIDDRLRGALHHDSSLPR